MATTKEMGVSNVMICGVLQNALVHEKIVAPYIGKNTTI
jgi:hypothetical protein